MVNWTLKESRLSHVARVKLHHKVVITTATTVLPFYLRSPFIVRMAPPPTANLSDTSLGNGNGPRPAMRASK